MIKVLNLYAGIGGNRKLWTDVDVTAVELNPEIAKIYQDFFLDDKVLVEDAHEYLLHNYKDFDFIWSSPPCPSHSDIRRCGVHNGQYPALYPDLKLWQEIILLSNFGKGLWVIENVIPYYQPIIQPKFQLDRHCFWSNFVVHQRKDWTKRETKHDRIVGNETIHGINLSNYNIKNKRQILRNMVNPEVGLHIFEQAFKRAGCERPGTQKELELN